MVTYVVILLCLMALALSAASASGDGGSEGAGNSEPNPTEVAELEELLEASERRSFTSIDEAQRVVSFDIKTPTVPGEFALDSVHVIETSKRETTKDTIVDIIYQSSDANTTIRLAITTDASQPWGKYGDTRFELERTDVLVNDRPAIAVTGRSSELTVGYLYWQADGLTYQLWYPGRTGASLVSLAETAQ